MRAIVGASDRPDQGPDLCRGSRGVACGQQVLAGPDIEGCEVRVVVIDRLPGLGDRRVELIDGGIDLGAPADLLRLDRLALLGLTVVVALAIVAATWAALADRASTLVELVARPDAALSASAWSVFACPLLVVSSAESLRMRSWSATSLE